MCLIKHPSKVLSRLNQHGRRVRTTLTCFAISLGYLICWLPIFIYKKKSELRKLFDQIKLVSKTRISGPEPCAFLAINRSEYKQDSSYIDPDKCLPIFANNLCCAFPYKLNPQLLFDND